MSDSIYLGQGDTIQQQGAGGGTSRSGSDADPDRAAHEAIIHRQWQQYAAALVADGELGPEQAKAYGKKMAEADIIRKLDSHGGEAKSEAAGAPWRRAQDVTDDATDPPSRGLAPQ